MKNTVKRVLSATMAMLMLVTLLPGQVFAAGKLEDYVTITHREDGIEGAIVHKDYDVVIMEGDKKLATGKYRAAVGVNNAVEITLNEELSGIYEIADITDGNALSYGKWISPEKDRVKFTFYNLTDFFGDAAMYLQLKDVHGDNHVFEELTRIEPTCTEKGSVTEQCKYCDAQRTTELEALGHDWNQWIYVDGSDTPEDHSGSKHSRSCTRCDAVEEAACVFAADPAQHVDATTTAEGKDVYVCADCGHSYEVALPKLETNVTLTYDANGGEGAPAAVTVPQQDGYVLDTTAPTHADVNGVKVVFVGWSETDDDTIYTLKQQLPALVSQVDLRADKVVYAVYGTDTDGNGKADAAETDFFTLTYDANGGANAPAAVTVKAQKGYALDQKTVPTHVDVDGAKVLFLGWSAADNDKIYARGDAKPALITASDVLADTTVYAVYGFDQNGDGKADVNQTFITLHYDANGGKTPPASVTVAADDATGEAKFTISKDVPTREAHDFKGWSTTKTGAVTVKAGETMTAKSDVTLYAVWAEKPQVTYTLKFDANGGKDAPETQTVTTKLGYGDLTVSTKAPTREGFVFRGWATTPKGGPNVKPGNTIRLTGDTTLYAVWQDKNALPKTGDESNIALWASLMGLSALAAGAVVLAKKRRED